MATTGPEEKAAKAFATAASNRLFNPYHFANVIKIEGGYVNVLFVEAAKAAFMLGEIDYRYGFGDPVFGEMCARVCRILEEYPDVTPYS